MRLRRARPPMAASPLASSDRVLGSGTIVYLPLSRLYPKGLGPKNPAVNVPPRAKLSPKSIGDSQSTTLKRGVHPSDDEMPSRNVQGTSEEEESRIIGSTHRSAAEEVTEISYLGIRGERVTANARGITLWHVDVTRKGETEGRSRHRPQHPALAPI